MRGHETILPKYQQAEVIQSMVSDYKEYKIHTTLKEPESEIFKLHYMQQ